MDRPDSFAACFPDPRDDEPATLRQDIADELIDHLASSLRRQLLITPDESQARAQALDHFGNPQHIARQLWFDAMKEKIMSQRLNLVATSLMAAVCLAALGLVILVYRDGQSLNAALLARLEALSSPTPVVAPPPESPVVSEWTRARFKLVQGKSGGPPAAFFNVQMQGTNVAGETQKNGYMVYGSIEETSDQEGIADLGMFRYGGYTLQVRAPWGESITRQIGLRPGQDTIREVVCPAAAPEEVDVAFQVSWPDDLRDRNLWLLFNFGFPATRHIGVDQWLSPSATPHQNSQMPGMGGAVPGGAIPDRDMVLLSSSGDISLRRTQITKNRFPNGVSVPEWVQFTPPSRLETTFSLPAANNWISELFVVDMAVADASPRLVLARLLPPRPGFSGMGGGMGGGFFNVADEKDERVHERAGWSFEPRPGIVNLWKIVLPDQLLDDVRAALKRERKNADEAEASN